MIKRKGKKEKTLRAMEGPMEIEVALWFFHKSCEDYLFNILQLI